MRDATGTIVGGVETFSDASAVVRAAEDADRVRHEALTDELTGLPNRRMFDAAVRTRLENMRPLRLAVRPAGCRHRQLQGRERPKSGHAVRDAVLAGVAKTILGAVRAGDIGGSLGRRGIRGPSRGLRGRRPCRNRRTGAPLSWPSPKFVTRPWCSGSR